MKTPSDVGAGFGGRQLPLAGLPLPEVCPFHTENPREVRIICALATGARSREELDRIAGASNVPDAIAALRRKQGELQSAQTRIEGEIQKLLSISCEVAS